MSTVASAYIKQGRLCIMGLHDSEMGPIPFAYSTEIEKDIPEGKVEVGAENLDPKIAKAIDAAREPMLVTIEEQKMKIGAEQLVERSRAGDQNAMAMIQEIRIQSKRSPKAEKALEFIFDYIKAHPADSSDGHYLPVARQLRAHIGEEAAISAWTPAIGDTHVAAILLQNGPMLSKERIETIGSHFGEDIEIFHDGVMNWKEEIPAEYDDDEAIRAFETGKAVGFARILQGVGEGKIPISRLCPIAGAELGE